MSLQQLYDDAFVVLTAKKILPPLELDYFLNLFFVSAEQSSILNYQENCIDVWRNEKDLAFKIPRDKKLNLSEISIENQSLLASACKEIITNYHVTQDFCQVYYAIKQEDFFNKLPKFEQHCAPSFIKISLLCLLLDNLATSCMEKYVNDFPQGLNVTFEKALKYSQSLPSNQKNMNARQKAWIWFEQTWQSRAKTLFKEYLIYQKLQQILKEKEYVLQKKI